MKKVLFIAFFLCGCSVLKPIPRDQKAIDQIFVIKADYHKMYQHYNFVQSEYSNIDKEIADLVVMDQARPNAGDLVANVQILQKYFMKFELEHKAVGIINEYEAKIYVEYLDDKIKDIITAENKLK